MVSSPFFPHLLIFKCAGFSASLQRLFSGTVKGMVGHKDLSGFAAD